MKLGRRASETGQEEAFEGEVKICITKLGFWAKDVQVQL